MSEELRQVAHRVPQQSGTRSLDDRERTAAVPASAQFGAILSSYQDATTLSPVPTKEATHNLKRRAAAQHRADIQRTIRAAVRSLATRSARTTICVAGRGLSLSVTTTTSKTADSEKNDRPKTVTLPRPSSNRTVGGFVAQFDLSSLCQRTPMAQAPNEWLTALLR